MARGVPGWEDLARGAGGKFRFLRAINDHTSRVKITELTLLRGGYMRHSRATNAKDKSWLSFYKQAKTAKQRQRQEPLFLYDYMGEQLAPSLRLATTWCVCRSLPLGLDGTRAEAGWFPLSAPRV